MADGEWGRYRSLDELPAVQREHYDVAQALAGRWVTRGEFRDAHADIQEALAERVRAAGFEPWHDGDPPVDLAWVDGDDVLNAIEAKSITDVNEVAQLRLGLGQVLHYAAVLRMQEPGREVRPILAVEKAPADAHVYSAACGSAGVVLSWGPDFAGFNG